MLNVILARFAEFKLWVSDITSNVTFSFNDYNVCYFLIMSYKTIVSQKFYTYLCKLLCGLKNNAEISLSHHLDVISFRKKRYRLFAKSQSLVTLKNCRRFYFNYLSYIMMEKNEKFMIIKPKNIIIISIIFGIF